MDKVYIRYARCYLTYIKLNAFRVCLENKQCGKLELLLF